MLPGMNAQQQSERTQSTSTGLAYIRQLLEGNEAAQRCDLAKQVPGYPQASIIIELMSASIQSHVIQAALSLLPAGGKRNSPFKAFMLFMVKKDDI